MGDDIVSSQSRDVAVRYGNRLGNRKSRTGCGTCKTRKVKCDEGQPICQRCLLGGRHCAGYADLLAVQDSHTGLRARANKSFNAPLGRIELVPVVSTSPTEQRALQYFRVNVAPVVGGVLEPSFWQSTVLQLSESEPTISWALLALSSQHEATMRANTDHLLASTQSTYYYNRALAKTAQRISGPDSELVALTTCVIFLCLEFLRQNQERAIQLYKIGANVLHSYLEGRSDKLKHKDDICGIFLPVYERLLVLGCFFGAVVPNFRPITSAVDMCTDYASDSWMDLEAARNVLFALISDSHKILALTRSNRTSRTIDDETMSQLLLSQQDQLRRYHDWQVKLEVCLAKIREKMTQEQQYVVSMLRLSHTSIVIWLSSAFARRESDFDRFQDLFFRNVVEAEKIIYMYASNYATTELFTFEMGVLAPLYLTVWKCRQSDLRRKAFSLLKQAPAIEGLWSRDFLVTVLDRVLDIEEKGRLNLAGEPSVHHVRVLDLQMLARKAGGTQVRFETEIGANGVPFRTWTETVLDSHRAA